MGLMLCRTILPFQHYNGACGVGLMLRTTILPSQHYSGLHDASLMLYRTTSMSSLFSTTVECVVWASCSVEPSDPFSTTVECVRNVKEPYIQLFQHSSGVCGVGLMLHSFQPVQPFQHCLIHAAPFPLENRCP